MNIFSAEIGFLWPQHVPVDISILCLDRKLCSITITGPYCYESDNFFTVREFVGERIDVLELYDLLGTFCLGNLYDVTIRDLYLYSRTFTIDYRFFEPNDTYYRDYSSLGQCYKDTENKELTVPKLLDYNYLISPPIREGDTGDLPMIFYRIERDIHPKDFNNYYIYEIDYERINGNEDL